MPNISGFTRAGYPVHSYSILNVYLRERPGYGCLALDVGEAEAHIVQLLRVSVNTCVISGYPVLLGIQAIAGYFYLRYFQRNKERYTCKKNFWD